jgi:hypothetical protein
VIRKEKKMIVDFIVAFLMIAFEEIGAASYKLPANGVQLAASSFLPPPFGTT